ncbi:MAG: histone deacetylase, partial [Deltaproteobacteria bacterium]|nr:histone deacetylase [Deltaproteobacteria bacterium]
MKNVAYVYHPDYLLHNAPFDHPESPDRLVAINRNLENAGLFETLVPVTPDYPDNGDILSVH